MKVLLVETSPLGINDVTVHVRNSMVLSNYLNSKYECRLVCDDTGIPNINEQFDFIIFISATFYFKHDRFLELIHNQKKCKIGWITNEFELFQQNFLKQHGTDFIIANFEEHGVKKAHKYSKFLLTNLNALQAKQRNDKINKVYNTCYYGTYRKYRDPYFKKYLINDMILSTSGKNIKKFQLLGCDCLLTDKFSWKTNEETLNLFHSTLYIEDTKTHSLFNHLANRWFESLFCNTACFFDKSCKNTIEKDVFYIDPFFIVDSYDEIIFKVKNMNHEILEFSLEENTMIALNEKIKTLIQIEQFLLNC
jgi:hypothetical protein